MNHNDDPDYFEKPELPRPWVECDDPTAGSPILNQSYVYWWRHPTGAMVMLAADSWHIKRDGESWQVFHDDPDEDDDTEDVIAVALKRESN